MSIKPGILQEKFIFLPKKSEKYSSIDEFLSSIKTSFQKDHAIIANHRKTIDRYYFIDYRSDFKPCTSHVLQPLDKGLFDLMKNV